MIILSHRGYWKTATEKNQPVAFARSFELGFGTETDVRDRNGVLVISHDMPSGTEITLDSFLDIFGDSGIPLAMNVKADGLAAALHAAMSARGVKDWFVFDMAVPDMRSYLTAGIPVFTRMSEVEKDPVWLEQSAGIWLDAFHGTWYDRSLIENMLSRGKRVCVVSAELHGRDSQQQWDMLRALRGHENLLLCTDYPEQARTFFGETL
jgi:glycerophosphoryl diester phosphodiesterase